MSPSRFVFADHVLLALVCMGTSCAPSSGGIATVSGSAPAPTSALAVDSALGTMAQRDLWPGFDPLRIPVAIFDGTHTYLFRHPHPPAGYAPLEGRDGVLVREGRDPLITANTGALLGGAATATVMLDRRLSAADAAALTIHELFHVFQRARHPDWQANEVELFSYPVDNSAALALRREETAVLRHALEATSIDSVRCWSRTFADVRARRFAVIGAGAAGYERGTELNEGLAQYVERRAAGRSPAVAADAPAPQVRQRAYDVGAAIGALLDRLAPTWRERLERAPSAIAPDSLLGAATQDLPVACATTAAERSAWLEWARTEIRLLMGERARLRDAYLARSGRRLVVETGTAPLFPAGFDPLNVTRLSATEILHTRFLKLQGAGGTIEVLGASALSEGAAGAHPLFAGVRRLTIAGLAAGITVRDSSGVVVVGAPGVVMRLVIAGADTTGEIIRLRLR